MTDRWDRKTDFGCASCMFWVPKQEHKVVGHPTPLPSIGTIQLGRCRRNAPTMKGYPVVYADGWCGEHKIGSNPVRDGGKAKTIINTVPPLSEEEIRVIERENELHREVIAEEKASMVWGKDQIFHHCVKGIAPYPRVLCSVCPPTVPIDGSTDFNAYEELKRLYSANEPHTTIGDESSASAAIKFEDTGGIKLQFGVDPEEKAKIKGRIRQIVSTLGFQADRPPKSRPVQDEILGNVRKLNELLEKL